MALALRGLTADRRTTLFRSTSFATTIALACVAYWFVGAPDRRFGGIFLWVVPAVALAPFFVRTSEVVTLLFVVALTWWNDGFAIHLRDGTAMPTDPARATTLKTFKNSDGKTFTINVPNEGDLCGDAPLPCSPYFEKQQMRTPGRLGRGFLP